MITLTQALIPVVLLSAVVFGLPLAEGNSSDGLTENGRIWGGDVAAVGQFPYQVSLEVEQIGQFAHVCGGSIITDRFVLTAAYCNIHPGNKYRVVAGENLLNGTNGTIYAVQRWIEHEHYYLNVSRTNANIHHNIALVETAEPIEFNKLVAPLALSRQFIKDGVRAITVGWGQVS